MDAMRNKKAPKEKELNIKIRNPKAGDQTVVCSNSLTIYQVKEHYLRQIDKSKVGFTEESTTEELIEKIRFFCMGKELKNELYVYSYDVENNMVVQAMFRN